MCCMKCDTAIYRFWNEVNSYNLRPYHVRVARHTEAKFVALKCQGTQFVKVQLTRVLR
jgi:hypothetical protein